MTSSRLQLQARTRHHLFSITPSLTLLYAFQSATTCASFLLWNSSRMGLDCASRSFCAARGFSPRFLFASFLGFWK